MLNKSQIGVAGLALGCLVLGSAVGMGLASRWPADVQTTSPTSVSERLQPPAETSLQPTVSERPRLVPAESTEVVPLVASLADTANIKSEFLQSAALYKFAAPLDANGIRGLLEDAETDLSGGDYQGGTSLLIGRYAELDFEGALEYALANGGKVRSSWLRSIFHARARIDVDEALLRAQSLSRSQRQVAGLAMLRSTDGLSSSQRQSIVDALEIPPHMVATARFHKADAWADTKTIEDPMQRLGAQAQVLTQWAQSDPWAALKASEEIDINEMSIGVQGAILALAMADDSQRALDWLNSQPDGELSDQLLVTLVSTMNTDNVDEVRVLLDRLPEHLRVQAEMGMWSRHAHSDPEGAADWVASLSTDSAATNGDYMNQVAPIQILTMLSMNSLEAAERFMDALPADRRSQLEGTYVQALARRDPAAAASRVAGIADVTERAEAAQSLISSWAARDPRRASRWLERQSGSAYPELYRTLGASWARRDLKGAREYADEMSAGAERDRMFAGILSSGRVQADDAETMVLQIEDSQLRAEADQLQEMTRRAVLGAQRRSLVIGSSSGLPGVMFNSDLSVARDETDNSADDEN